MTVQDILSQVEHVHGRQPHQYIMQLINDALLDIASKKQHYTSEERADLTSGIRWISLPADCIDIIKVEILDNDNRYNMIPKLTDPHRLLKSDPDEGTGDLT